MIEYCCYTAMSALSQVKSYKVHACTYGSAQNQKLQTNSQNYRTIEIHIYLSNAVRYE